MIRTNKATAVSVGAAVVLAGACIFGANSAHGGLLGGKDPRFEITYQPPGDQTVSLAINVNDKVSNIYYVDVCSDSRWQRAAYFAPGMYRTGALIVNEQRLADLNDKMRAQATALPESAEIKIPAGKRVLVAVRSNWQGMPLSNRSRCELVAAFDTKPAFDYRGSWNISDKVCSLQVTEVAAGQSAETAGSLLDLTPSATDNECKFKK